MFDTIYIYVPGEQQIIKISEGTGDNLTDEDMLEGYVDYIYYEQYSREHGFPEVDGGMVRRTVNGLSNLQRGLFSRILREV